MDNSDSSSIVEQLSQGPSLVYNTFINDKFPSSLTYPMPYALFLASCNMGSPMFLFLDLMFPYHFQSLSIPGLLIHSLQAYWLTPGVL